MERRELNQSVIDSLAVVYKTDKEKVRKYIYDIIDKGEYILDLGKVNKVWGGKSVQLGQVFDNYNDGRPTLDKQAYSPKGKIWRKMSMGTFRKKYPRGTYMIRLENEMIVIKDLTDIVGDYTVKSRVFEAFKITK